MKKYPVVLLAAVITVIQFTLAQTPQGMNYQAVARNAAGNILSSQSIGIRFTITDGSGGSVLYQETHTISTNQFGLFTLNVGSGTPVAGSFPGINWSSVNAWLNVEMDPAGGTAYVSMGNSELLSVPYALMAKEVEADSGWGLTGNGGTLPGTNFIGTTDNVSMVFKTNNQFSGSIDPDFPYNTSLGFQSLSNNTTGSENVAIGSSTMYANSTGSNNTAVGALALSTNDGNSNTAVGHSALRDNTIGVSNTAIGNEALLHNTTGFSNVAIGTNALYSNTNRSHNVAVGDSALYSNNTGDFNTAVGSKTLFANTSGFGNTAYGTFALNMNTVGNGNTATGHEVLPNNTSGGGNTAYGKSALYQNTVGNGNTAISVAALFSNTNGAYNTAVGYSALNGNTSGYSNVAVGASALYSNTGQNNLVAIGDSALANNSNGSANTAIGSKALFTNDYGYENTALGSAALYSNTSGSGNTASGKDALASNTIGTANTAHGKSALYSNTTGDNNAAFATGALSNNSSGSNNTAVGYGSLNINATGFQNTAVGATSLNGTTSGAWNTAVGYNTGPNAFTYQNTTCLGIDATATGSDMVRIGNTYVTSIGGQVGWTTLSDGRFKEDVKENVPGLNFISLLRPVTYQLNREEIMEASGLNDRRQKIKEQNPGIEFLGGEKYSEVITGFIAQEVEDAARKTGFDFSGLDKPKNEADFYGLRYAEFVVPLVKAVQELNAENRELKNEISLIKAVLNSGQQQRLEELKTSASNNR